MTHIRAVLLSLLAMPALAQLQRVCLDEFDGGGGLALATTITGEAALSRVRLVSGDVVYTVVDHGGEPVNEVVAPRVSRFGLDSVEDTDLLFVEGRPHICHYNAAEQHFQVSSRGDGGPDWSAEVVAQGVGAGRWCALGLIDDQLVVAYSQDGALWFARRRGDDDWATEPVDDGGPDNDAGFEVDLSVGPDGTPVIAHRDRTLGRLHISFHVGFWQTVEVGDERFAVGVRPAIAHRADGGVWIAHGVVGGGVLDQESDGGLLLTGGVLPGPLTTEPVDPNQAYGGTNGLVVSDDGGPERVLVATRQLLRSGLFPDANDVRLYDALPAAADRTILVASDPGERRRAYTRVNLVADPFDSVVAAYNDDAIICLHRAPDADEDGLPDAIEPEFDTNPLDPDSDDDGVSDGAEVLRDRTNPNGEGPLVEPDAAIPDAAIPDAAIPDAAIPDAAIPDAAAPDAANVNDVNIPPPDANPADSANVNDVNIPADAAPASDSDPVDAANVNDVNIQAPDLNRADAANVDDVNIPPSDAEQAADANVDAVDMPVEDGGRADSGGDVNAVNIGDGGNVNDVNIPPVDGRAADGAGDARRADPDSAGGVDASVVGRSDVRVDGDLPPLSSLAEDRSADCACSGTDRGLVGWWLLLLVGLRRRR